ncbi:MAG: DUF2442 domain-containing protein [Bacteroidetes bacterium]|nr:DUF2442 domain-containing protein [Bacteroidota bacterium]
MKSEKIVEGYWDVTPEIKTISFAVRGRIRIELKDGRILFVPVSAFPSIKRLSMKDRKKWYRFGNGFSFDNCNEVFHIEQILGNFLHYRHEA